jgi:acyl-ACP thioesterase
LGKARILGYTAGMSNEGDSRTKYAHGWRREFQVGSYEVDPSGCLKLASLFNYLQETAGGHAEHLDLGYHALRERDGLGFVLSRITVEIAKMPTWEERIVLITWPKRAEKLLALRDFLIVRAESLPHEDRPALSRQDLEELSANAEPLVRATTAWLLIDVERMRPVRPEKRLGSIPISPDLEAISTVPRRLLQPSGPPMSEQTRIVHYSDIDQNDHVNNARYVEWMTDFLAASAVPTAEHSLPAPSVLEVNFSGEVKLGDKAVLRGREDEEAYVVWIDRDDKNAVIASFQW